MIINKKLMWLVCFLFLISCSAPTTDPASEDSTSESNKDDKEQEEEETVEEEEDSSEADGEDNPTVTTGNTLALGTNPQRSFPTGLAVSALPEKTDDSPVPPAIAGSLAIGVGLADEKEPEPAVGPGPGGDFDRCADVDFDQPMTPFVGGGGPQGQVKNDNMFLLCRQSLSYGEKYEEQRELLTGKANKCFRRRWIQGITMQLANGCFTFGMSNDSGLVPPENKVCSVAFTQEEAGKVAALLETGLLISAAAICQSIKDENPIELPEAVGGAVDLKSHLQKAFTEASEDATIDLARVTKLADEDGRPTYKTQIDLSGLAGSVRKLEDYSLTVIHTPPAEDSADFHGRMWINFTNTGPETSPRVMNVAYAHKGKTAEDLRTIYETRYMERIDLVTGAETKDFFNEDGRIDYEKIFQNQGSSNYNNQVASFVNGIRYVAMDVNPWSGAGRMAVFQNPGVDYNENAVGMAFELDTDNEDQLSGCSIAGAMNRPSISIRKILAEGGDFVPTGRRCGNGTGDGGLCRQPSIDDEYVYYQCFKKNTEGKFEIDSSKITNTVRGYDEKVGNTVSITPVSVDAIPKYEQNLFDDL